jgi:hypothetical protein
MRSNALDKIETTLIGRKSEEPEGVPTGRTIATFHIEGSDRMIENMHHMTADQRKETPTALEVAQTRRD